MAACGLKVISFAFKDMPLKKLNEMMHSYSLESPEFRSEIESDLIYLCTFGLDDPLRIHRRNNTAHQIWSRQWWILRWIIRQHQNGDR
jgi:hypothetical protein